MLHAIMKPRKDGSPRRAGQATYLEGWENGERKREMGKNEIEFGNWNRYKNYGKWKDEREIGSVGHRKHVYGGR